MKQVVARIFSIRPGQQQIGQGLSTQRRTLSIAFSPLKIGIGEISRYAQASGSSEQLWTSSLLKNGRAKLLLSRTSYAERLGGSLALPKTGFSTGG